MAHQHNRSVQDNCYGNNSHILTLYLKAGLDIFCWCVDTGSARRLSIGAVSYVARGGKTQALEGQPPKSIVVLAFDSTEKALAWYNSPAYEAIKAIRQGASVSRMFMAEGLPPQ